MASATADELTPAQRVRHRPRQLLALSIALLHAFFARLARGAERGLDLDRSSYSNQPPTRPSANEPDAAAAHQRALINSLLFSRAEPARRRPSQLRS